MLEFVSDESSTRPQKTFAGFIATSIPSMATWSTHVKWQLCTTNGICACKASINALINAAAVCTMSSDWKVISTTLVIVVVLMVPYLRCIEPTCTSAVTLKNWYVTWPIQTASAHSGQERRFGQNHMQASLYSVNAIICACCLCYSQHLPGKWYIFKGHSYFVMWKFTTQQYCIMCVLSRLKKRVTSIPRKSRDKEPPETPFLHA